MPNGTLFMAFFLPLFRNSQIFMEFLTNSCPYNDDSSTRALTPPELLLWARPQGRAVSLGGWQRTSGSYMLDWVAYGKMFEAFYTFYTFILLYIVRHDLSVLFRGVHDCRLFSNKQLRPLQSSWNYSWTALHTGGSYLLIKGLLRQLVPLTFSEGYQNHYKHGMAWSLYSKKLLFFYLTLPSCGCLYIGLQYKTPPKILWDFWL